VTGVQTIYKRGTEISYFFSEEKLDRMRICSYFGCTNVCAGILHLC
jgi:hypothetical protein